MSTSNIVVCLDWKRGGFWSTIYEAASGTRRCRTCAETRLSVIMTSYCGCLTT